MTNEKTYGILADGFSAIKVDSFKPDIFKTSDEETMRLDAFVREQQERAAAKGGLFYDANMIGVDMSSIKANGNTLEVGLRGMKYSQHAGSFRLNPKAPMQALYVCGLLITADNKLVFGTTQATEADWMGKLGIVAGAVEVSPDGYPSLGAQLYREASEEIGATADHHLDVAKIVPGWVNARSTREGNYHLTTSFVVPLRITENELLDYFANWSAATKQMAGSAIARGHKIRAEFKDLRFLPNDAEYLSKFIKEQDEKGKAANFLGKSMDVLDEWVSTYDCNLEKLVASKANGAKVYTPQ